MWVIFQEKADRRWTRESVQIELKKDRLARANLRSSKTAKSRFVVRMPTHFADFG